MFLFLKYIIKLNVLFQSYGKMFLIDQNNLINTIKARQPIEYKVVFPSISYLPQVTKIFYDGDTFCIGPEGKFTTYNHSS